jgi:ribosomal protein L21E
MDRPDYEAACKRATTNQGLDPVVAVLKGDGIKVVVDQTGGFTMVASVYHGKTWFGITQGDDDGYLVCFYEDEEADGKIVADGVHLKSLPDLVRKPLTL